MKRLLFTPVYAPLPTPGVNEGGTQKEGEEKDGRKGGG